MKILKCATLITILLSTQLLAKELELKCNPKGETQLDLNICANADYKKADKVLNSIYKKLIKIKKDDELYIKRLKVSQRLWIKFRDAEINTIFSCEDINIRMCWGSMADMLYSEAMIKLTKERTVTLQKYIEEFNKGSEN